MLLPLVQSIVNTSSPDAPADTVLATVTFRELLNPAQEVFLRKILANIQKGSKVAMQVDGRYIRFRRFGTCVPPTEENMQVLFNRLDIGTVSPQPEPRPSKPKAPPAFVRKNPRRQPVRTVIAQPA